VRGIKLILLELGIRATLSMDRRWCLWHTL
jgi:hypothetical protein